MPLLELFGMIVELELKWEQPLTVDPEIEQVETVALFCILDYVENDAQCSCRRTP